MKTVRPAKPSLLWLNHLYEVGTAVIDILRFEEELLRKEADSKARLAAIRRDLKMVREEADLKTAKLWTAAEIADAKARADGATLPSLSRTGGAV